MDISSSSQLDTERTRGSATEALAANAERLLQTDEDTFTFMEDLLSFSSPVSTTARKNAVAPRKQPSFMDISLGAGSTARMM